jgi:CBS domain-containing protein
MARSLGLSDDSESKEVTNMELRDLVGGEVESIDRDVTIAAAASRMEQAGVGSLAVTDEGELIGILTERDVLRSVAHGAGRGAQAVADWMTPYPDSFFPDMDITEAAEWMLAAGYRHLPVVDGGTLIGMVSIKDVLWGLTGQGAG